MDWLQRQEAALLPIPYFHVVFTLPHLLHPLIRQNRRALFKLLFESAAQTLLAFGRHELKAQLGLTAVLHTWGQTLVEHYHVHCIVTGGGLALDGSGWVQSSSYYLFAVRALSQMFGGKFRAGLQRLHAQGKLEFHGQIQALSQPATFAPLLHQLQGHKPVVYAKKPFAGPQQVLKYLSRYTHRVAISHGRLRSVSQESVTFSYKDYADGHRRKTMTLAVEEFVRRFCLHLLPERFVKIRHYGLLGNRNRAQRLQQARQCLGVAPPAPPEAQDKASPGTVPTPAEERPRLRCPHCGADALVWVEEVPRGRRSVRPVLICDSS